MAAVKRALTERFDRTTLSIFRNGRQAAPHSCGVREGWNLP